MSKSGNWGEKNGMWKGDEPIHMTSLHEWVKRRFPKPEICQRCGLVPPLDLSNKGIYDRNLDNWEWLCRKCHMTIDGRISRLYHGGNQPKNRKCSLCEHKHSAKGLCHRHYLQMLTHGRIMTP